MMDILQMQTMVALAEELSFTAAAQRLGVAKSVVSRRLTEMEAELGAQLLLRNTRSVMLTEPGQVFYRDVLEILDQIAIASDRVRGKSGKTSGRLRLSVPVNYFQMVLAERFDQFAAAHPEVSLDIHQTDARSDVISEGFDAAIRVGELADSSLIARKIAETSSACFASPDYVKRHGAPKGLEDLSNHECLIYTNLSTGSEWIFKHKGQVKRKRVHGRFHANSGTYLLRMAIKGHGITRLPCFMTDEALANGQLVRVLEDFEPEIQPINVVFASRVNMRAALRALIDFLSEG